MNAIEETAAAVTGVSIPKEVMVSSCLTGRLAKLKQTVIFGLQVKKN